MSVPPEVVLQVRDAVKRFPLPRTLTDVVKRRPAAGVTAVAGVTVDVHAGEVLAVVGESGCGKTTLATLLLGLEQPSEGRIVVAGVDLAGLDRAGLNRVRRNIQIVFQDPYESLNPRMTVREIVTESLHVHRVGRGEEEALVAEALEQAGLTPVETYLDRLPHEMSGGQRQRVCIAGALVLQPRILIADEPVSMLDVSTRAEILDLLARLAAEQDVAIVMITHDLSTVAAYSDRLAVMYLGRIVEVGPTEAVLRAPRHPYTRALLSVVPVPSARHRRRPVILEGETPDPSRIPTGCRFHPRCPVAVDRCRTVDPPLEPVGAAHEAACILAEPEGRG